ncbi:phage baseplate assembly protein [Acetobacter sicerae]|uniref:Phage baseplate assembly protein n=1 Tax=Acetobacter sicerae TaxID=85325 RepID=A0ABS8VWJ8_9PROT|nr:phage baseplate assembly protein [Acetobacter sicerae]MCE0744599.1 phage baseplate assembly protein [Acetobacter sicerae]
MTEMGLRAHTVRAVIHSVDDTGAEQKLETSSHVGGRRTKVPVHWPFGFSAVVPANGAVTHVVANGGDQADLYALPPSNPSAARLGGLSEGESCLYDSVGQRVWLRGGRIVQVDVHTALSVQVAGALVMQVAASGVTIQGDLSVSGDTTVGGSVVAKGDVKAGSISLEDHTHSGVKAGSDSTGGPQ